VVKNYHRGMEFTETHGEWFVSNSDGGEGMMSFAISAIGTAGFNLIKACR